MNTQKQVADRRKAVLDEKRNVTSRISETCRFIGFGLLAIYYAVWIGDASPEGLSGGTLRVVGLAGAMAIALDYAQYFFGARAVEDALRRDDHKYDDASLFYRGRLWCFYLKQGAVAVGVLALIASIALASSASASPSA